MTDPLLRSLALEIKTAEPSGLRYPELRQGVVKDIAVSLETLTVEVGGDVDSPQVGAKWASSYVPVIGDTVWILKNGSDHTVFASVSGANPISSNGNNGFGPSVTQTTTSSTFVNLTGTGVSFSFTKFRTRTRLKLEVTGTLFYTTSTAEAALGLQFNVVGQTNGATYSVAHHAKVLANTERGNWAGIRVLPAGIPAGIYTVQAQWLRAGGTGTLNRNLNDPVSAFVTEIL